MRRAHVSLRVLPVLHVDDSSRRNCRKRKHGGACTIKTSAVCVCVTVLDNSGPAKPGGDVRAALLTTIEKPIYLFVRRFFFN